MFLFTKNYLRHRWIKTLKKKTPAHFNEHKQVTPQTISRKHSQ